METISQTLIFCNSIEVPEYHLDKYYIIYNHYVMRYLKDTQDQPRQRKTARDITSAMMPSRPDRDESPLTKRLRIKREMEKAKLIERDEDGIIIYDESDDYDPGEDEDYQYENATEEIFTEHYMLDFAKKMDAKIATETTTPKIISAVVILMVILFPLLIFWLVI